MSDWGRMKFKSRSPINTKQLGIAVFCQARQLNATTFTNLGSGRFVEDNSFETSSWTESLFSDDIL